MNVKNLDNICMNCFSERTSGVAVCPVCGYDEAARGESLYHLPPRSVLNGKYLIGHVLGEGGFGITYVGYDLNLDIKVAVKEYYPSGFVTRTATHSSTVQTYGGEQGEIFHRGRERFVDEAKRLARFRTLRGIVMVNDFFVENGTAYIVMEFVEGVTLKSYMAQMGGKLPADKVLDMLAPVFSSLAEVHQSGIIHRDISPDNIMIAPDGSMKLLDFGAAREFGVDERSLSVMLKHGYAPMEQYSTRGQQGPHTDVYALCATIYKAITGVTPESAMDRIIEDVAQPPSALGVVLPPQQEAALMKGLAVRAENRWQTVVELQAALLGGVQTPPTPNVQPPPPQPYAPPAPAAPQYGRPGTVAPTPHAPAPPPAQNVAPPPTPNSSLLTPNSPPPTKKSKTDPAVVVACVVAVVIVLVFIGIGIATSGNNSGEDARQASTSSMPTPDAILGVVEPDIGDIIQFGDYDWLVLDVQDGRALIITDEIIEDRAYHGDRVDVTWAKSDIRAHLNGIFYSRFSANDKAQIIKVTNQNLDNQWFGTDGGAETQDHIFLLSLSEVVLYFGDSGQLDDRPLNSTHWIDDQYNNARRASSGGASLWWWLRSPGGNPKSAATVNSDGDIYILGQSVHFYGYYGGGRGVRPAMWIILD